MTSEPYFLWLGEEEVGRRVEEVWSREVRVSRGKTRTLETTAPRAPEEAWARGGRWDVMLCRRVSRAAEGRRNRDALSERLRSGGAGKGEGGLAGA